jgi:hypothetical protein
MTRRRNSLLVMVIAVVGVIGWVAYSFLHTLRHIPEAYAAWDTGTLLIEYMKQHDDQWPKSWEELLNVLNADDGRRIPLRGAQAGDPAYGHSLRQKVAIDWAFNPTNPGTQNPVTPRRGGKFSVVWDGADPNEMVRLYLSNRAATRPSATHEAAGFSVLARAPSEASLASIPNGWW